MSYHISKLKDNPPVPLPFYEAIKDSKEKIVNSCQVLNAANRNANTGQAYKVFRD